MGKFRHDDYLKSILNHLFFYCRGTIYRALLVRYKSGRDESRPYTSGTKMTPASGGKTISAEQGSPIQGIGSAWISPALPRLLPV